MADKEDRGDAEGMKVTDHRRFTPEGETRADAEGTQEAASAAGSENEGKREEGSARPEAREMPEIDFQTFILSLATSAQVHLGSIPNPATGKQEQDLSLARQTIDILGILEGKTKGNLTDQEARLLEHVLFDLRVRYVELNKK